MVAATTRGQYQHNGKYQRERGAPRSGARAGAQGGTGPLAVRVRGLVKSYSGTGGLPGHPFSWTDVLIVAAWGLGGLLVAVRFFSWEPRA